MGTRTSVDAAETRGVEWQGERPVGQLAFVADGPSWRPGSARRERSRSHCERSQEILYPGRSPPERRTGKSTIRGLCVPDGTDAKRHRDTRSRASRTPVERRPSRSHNPREPLEPFRRTPTPLPLARTMFAVAARHPTSVSVGRPFAPLAARARVASAAPLRAARAPRARARDVTTRAAGTIQKVTKDELEEMMKVRAPTRPFGPRLPPAHVNIYPKTSPPPPLSFASSGPLHPPRDRLLRHLVRPVRAPRVRAGEGQG